MRRMDERPLPSGLAKGTPMYARGSISDALTTFAFLNCPKSSSPPPCSAPVEMVSLYNAACQPAMQVGGEASPPMLSAERNSDAKGAHTQSRNMPGVAS